MNVLALMVGGLVSIYIILRFKKARLEKSKFTYALLLVTFPCYYFYFAVYGSDYVAFSLEVLWGGVFFFIAASSVKLNHFYKFNVLAFGYILHGIYDITHNHLFINEGTPLWWPEFCGVIDIIIGLYLLNLAFKCRI